jgi:hypothetical protein
MLFRWPSWQEQGYESVKALAVRINTHLADTL